MHVVQLAERVGMEPQYLREYISTLRLSCIPGGDHGPDLDTNLVRIMRLLASHNIFLEMGAGSQWFANNRVSLRLDSKEALAHVLGEEP